MPSELVQLIKKFQQSIAAHVPALENEVNSIIEEKETNTNSIEHLLDTLLSLTTAGVGEPLFIKLLNYYKTISKDGAADYWRYFEEMNE